MNISIEIEICRGISQDDGHDRLTFEVNDESHLMECTLMDKQGTATVLLSRHEALGVSEMLRQMAINFLPDLENEEG